MDPARKESILKARLFIERNLHEDLSGERISEQAFCSYYHFHHQFREVTGESLWQYVKRLRLERAAFLLKFTAVPVSEIAFEVGFESAAAFSKAFRSRTGSSPIRYRQLALMNFPEGANGHYNWKESKKVRLPDEKIYTFRTEGVRHFPAGYFKWQKLLGDAGNLPLIGKTPDQPGITLSEKIRWDTSVPQSAITGHLLQQSGGQEHLIEETLPGGTFLQVPFLGFGKPLAQHLPSLLAHLRDQGLEWRPSGRFFQTIREHAENSTCITDLFIPIAR